MPCSALGDLDLSIHSRTRHCLSHPETTKGWEERGGQTGRTRGWDVAQLVRASDRHAADAGSIPPRVNFQCRLSFGVRTSPCAIACINICAHYKDPVVHVSVWWDMATQTNPARAISDKNNQLDDCGRSSAMSMLLQHGYILAL